MVHGKPGFGRRKGRWRKKSPECFFIQSSVRKIGINFDLSLWGKRNNCCVLLHYFSFKTQMPTFFIYKYLSFDFSQYQQFVQKKINLMP